MLFDATFKEFQDKIEDRLSELSTIKEPVLIYEPFNYFMKEGGKRIRPILTMLASGAVGGNPYEALDCSCSIEILHNFTLVHDDIMDKSDMRRGRPTVHKKWDEPVAILTGDAMIGIAYKIIPKHDRFFEIIQCFTNGLIEVCEGQVLDMQFNGRKDVSIDEYLLMIEKKTARLLQTCVEVGANCGNASDSQISALNDYAKNLGLAFQIQDDMLDMIADESKLGKKVGLDIQEGKKTFLIIKANELAQKQHHKELIEKYFDSNGLASEYVPQFISMFKELDIFNIAENEIQNYFRSAEQSLQTLDDNEYVRHLKGLIDKLNNRIY